ncbi:MAG: S41 family peptidase [Defluviitaleaceae bacterium]|nr:S41 family peptidase [Defluviitaleaceae bacterium]
MKKMMLATILALAMVALAACDDEEVIEEGLTSQHFLEDLDYMLYVLENNLSLFDVAYWARGVDIHALAEGVRADILADPDIHVDDFYNILLRNFNPLNGFAHFSIIDPAVHRGFVEHHALQQHLRWASGNWRLLYPHVLAFYEPRHPEGEIPYAGMGNVVEIGPNVITEIIEEGKVAYLSVSSFFVSGEHLAYEEEKIHSFFKEIRDYEHLILDFRRNGGGFGGYFIDLIMGPNIETNLRIGGYGFLRHGTYVAEAIHSPNISIIFPNRMIHLDNQLRPIAEMLDEFDMPDLNMNDTERLEYGFRIQQSVSARRLTRFDSQPAFGGQIWMLTSPQMGSASQLAAWIAKETEFAILVGDITGGVFGGPSTIVALPNTGISFIMDVLYITDSRGRPLEAGTIPHYFNREGMDALETVLEMIAEGGY